MGVEVRAICPACASITLKGRVDPKFYFNPESGLGYCHHCNFKGKFTEEGFMEQLNVVEMIAARAFDPSTYADLKPLSKEALSYLLKRFPQANADDLEPFGFRYHPGHHAVAIPLWDREGELQGIKYRYLAPLGDNRYMSETGSQFGGYWLAGSPDRVLVVEGEFDAIAAKLSGFKGTVVALQTNKATMEAKGALAKFKYVWLALDNDEAGNKGSEELLNLQGPKEIARCLLPQGKDLNDYAQAVGFQQCGLYLAKATQTDLERCTVNLTSAIPEMLEFLSDERNTRGTSTGYKCLDHLLGGGLRPQEMTVINAFAKTGKTSFINNLIHNLAAQDKKVAVASFEMDPARALFPSLLSIAGESNLRTLKPAALKETVQLIQDNFLYLGNIITLKRFGYTAWKEVEEWAALMKEQHDIGYLVLDHAGFMVEKMTDAEENQTLAKSIKKLTNTLGIHIFVVVQAPKTKDGLSIQTSYGGLAWGMNADNFMILERSRDPEKQTELHVKLEAARYPGANPNPIPTILFYDRETCRLEE